MSGPLSERLNKIMPRIVSDEFLSGSGIGNEIAFYIFDYPPEDELRVRDFLRTLHGWDVAAVYRDQGISGAKGEISALVSTA